MKDQCQTTKLNLPFILAFNENRKIFALILTHCLAEYYIIYTCITFTFIFGGIFDFSLFVLKTKITRISPRNAVSTYVTQYTING